MSEGPIRVRRISSVRVTISFHLQRQEATSVISGRGLFLFGAASASLPLAGDDQGGGSKRKITTTAPHPSPQGGGEMRPFAVSGIRNDGGRGLPGIFQNVHALAPAVDQIKPAVLVTADIVRLDARRA